MLLKEEKLDHENEFYVDNEENMEYEHNQNINEDNLDDEHKQDGNEDYLLSSWNYMFK